ncbi:MAG: dihydroneopterin aldolase [Flavobacteriales bacterium]|nr:dihydroneopterin aldolase [Flavobacteriales bacterium]MBP9080689.1 dihydroneopterin aldolase [Flavobacteriales bacterium]
MGLIEVKGIRLYAYHGCLSEEGRIGGHYRVDVAVEGDLARAERTDKLSDTIDYSRVTAIVVDQMAVRSKLIEQVAARILAALQKEWPHGMRWRVRLEKEHPPIPGAVDCVVYTVEG